MTTPTKKPQPTTFGPRAREDDGNAFFPDPEGGPAVVEDDLAEELAEEFVVSATSGEEAAEESLDQTVPEEGGGPFVTTSAEQEFAEGTDASNPDDAEPAPFPTTGSTSARK